MQTIQAYETIYCFAYNIAIYHSILKPNGRVVIHSVLLDFWEYTVPQYTLNALRYCIKPFPYCPYVLQFNCRYNVTIGSSSSILGPEIPEATKDTFRQHLNSYNFWSLTGKIKPNWWKLKHDVQLFGNIAWVNSVTRHCNTGRAELHSHVLLFRAGLEYVITQLKSVVLSLGIIDRHLSVEQAVLLSRLEEEYQVGGLHRKFPPWPFHLLFLN